MPFFALTLIDRESLQRRNDLLRETALNRCDSALLPIDQRHDLPSTCHNEISCNTYIYNVENKLSSSVIFEGKINFSF